MVKAIILSTEAGSSLSSDEDGVTESSSVTEGCSSASEVQQEPQHGTSTSKPREQRRVQKKKRMSANEKFKNALLEQQGKLISGLENATLLE
ncbi:hypothetical protein MTO96_030298 [Rhipicephalus appendiculatus]